MIVRSCSHNFLSHTFWFYLAEYHVSLPDEFLEKARANNYEVPTVPDAVLEELSLRVREMVLEELSLRVREIW